jgi:hypothetical protein
MSTPSQIELMFLDAVFHLASRTVVVGMELAGTHLLGGQGSDNKVTLCPSAIIGDFTHQPTGATPGILGTIVERLSPNLRGHQSIEVWLRMSSRL